MPGNKSVIQNKSKVSSDEVLQSILSKLESIDSKLASLSDKIELNNQIAVDASKKAVAALRLAEENSHKISSIEMDLQGRIVELENQLDEQVNRNMRTWFSEVSQVTRKPGVKLHLNWLKQYTRLIAQFPKKK